MQTVEILRLANFDVVVGNLPLAAGEPVEISHVAIFSSAAGDAETVSRSSEQEARHRARNHASLFEGTNKRGHRQSVLMRKPVTAASVV